MYFFALLIGLMAIAYALLIFMYRYWFKRLALFLPDTTTQPIHFFSVIIPARNEEGTIGACLAALAAQKYPAHLFEVIVINDHSEDNTVSEILAYQGGELNLSIIHLEDYIKGKKVNAYKKKAIEIAIAKAKGNWIVTTDADCTMYANWLRLLDAYIQKYEPVLVAAPVMFTDKSGILSKFQLLDFLSLQGITAAAVAAGYHSMCNGANLAYAKEAFYAVGQFSGIDHLASGDDMLLMHKMKKKFSGKMGFLFNENAIVFTRPMDTWRSFFQQRIRWASKADSYSDKSIFYVLLLVYFFNASLLFACIYGLWDSAMLYYALLVILFKTSIELFFLLPVAQFFSATHKLWIFPFLQPIHILYTVIAGWLGKFGSYEWKERKVN